MYTVGVFLVWDFHKQGLLCSESQKPQHERRLHVILPTHFTHASQRSFSDPPHRFLKHSDEATLLQPRPKTTESLFPPRCSAGELRRARKHDDLKHYRGKKQKCSNIQSCFQQFDSKHQGNEAYATPPSLTSGRFSRLHSEELILELMLRGVFTDTGKRKVCVRHARSSRLPRWKPASRPSSTQLPPTGTCRGCPSRCHARPSCPTAVSFRLGSPDG